MPLHPFIQFYRINYPSTVKVFNNIHFIKPFKMKTKSLSAVVSVLFALIMMPGFASANTRHTDPVRPVPSKFARTTNNSTVYNYRPSGWTFEMPVIAVTHGGTTDYYYLDVIVMNNNTSFSFEMPNISGVTAIRLYHLSEHNFIGTETATLSSNGSTVYGVPDAGGENWMNFSGINITNGLILEVY